jgi:spore germination cell wall hydrolase CwlJ-like protein
MGLIKLNQRNYSMTSLILTIAFLVPISAQANEENCLAQIIFAESRGEPIEGAVAVGQAAVNRAKRTGKTICGLSGVSRLTPPQNLMSHYLALAKSVMQTKISIVKDSDSWNTGTKPSRAGKIVRQIGAHVFYVMTGL